MKVRILTAVVVLGSGIVLQGCGGGSEDAPQQQAAQPTATTPQTQPSVQQSAASQGTAQTPQVDPNRKETKWIGSIPYDVFYDQPLTVASDPTLISGSPATGTAPTTGGAMAANTAPPAEQTPAATEQPATSGSGTVNWSEVIPMPVLIEELKNIRTRLTTNLQTVATYNRSAEAIALDGSIVAALGAVVTVHPEAETWKDRGKFIRDLGYEIYSSSGESGRTAFKSTEEPFLKLQTSLDGGTVDGLEAEEVVPFSDVAYVSEMMKRIETSFNNLKANINTEARMKEDPAAVMRDLHVLATLGTIMGTESYDNADAKKYQEFVATFVNGAKSGIEAVKAENYEGFRDGLNQIQTTCAECHQQYRGSESGF